MSLSGIRGHSFQPSYHPTKLIARKRRVQIPVGQAQLSHRALYSLEARNMACYRLFRIAAPDKPFSKRVFAQTIPPCLDHRNNLQFAEKSQ